ncbi:hypothetical protein FEM48_Zijuj02G0191600 [Ziziphus jujuba var. spinosa]|uniref:ATP-dependent DNA ligase family profile domain-containing protein n=1 Tax=Ziziphus jujuba var. spinosa TaxID=714518 RepID=A0A978VXG4_ZIZJJ|nr:hypothetical protein FEM48_Zijuj02G0191600 [Ziziphus jujuba var. spinosa]
MPAKPGDQTYEFILSSTDHHLFFKAYLIGGPIRIATLTSAPQSCEGLIIKTLNKDATYEPSKRSLNWLELTRALSHKARVGMARQLTNLGNVTWMSSCVAKLLQSFSLSWLAAFGVLQAAYFFIHYLFASHFLSRD